MVLVYPKRYNRKLNVGSVIYKAHFFNTVLYRNHVSADRDLGSSLMPTLFQNKSLLACVQTPS